MQKCSLRDYREWEGSKRTDAEGSHLSIDLFLGPLVCKAVGERISDDIKAKEQSVHPILIIYQVIEGRVNTQTSS